MGDFLLTPLRCIFHHHLRTWIIKVLAVILFALFGLSTWNYTNRIIMTPPHRVKDLQKNGMDVKTTIRSINLSSEIPICNEKGRAVLIYKDSIPISKYDFNNDIHPLTHRSKYTFRADKSGKVSNFCTPKDKNFDWRVLANLNQSCAIVGSSGILLNSSCGKEIDSHGLVMRFNMAPFGRNFSTDVGLKTDLMALNYEVVRFMVTEIKKIKKSEAFNEVEYKLKQLNNTIVWFPKSTKSFKDPLKQLLTFSQSIGVHLRFGVSWLPVTQVEKKWSIRTASLGFAVLDVSPTLCSSVTMYGFYPYQTNSRGTLVFHHYYDKKYYNFSTSMHDMNKEYSILHNLHKQGKIKLVLDKCT